MNRIVLYMAAMLATPAAAQSPSPPGPACAGPEYRTLDFWVGDWIASWTNPDGTKGAGTNRITRDEYGGCVITERYRSDDGTLDGFSISTYRPGLKQWRQTWVDAQGGYFDLVGGPMPGSDDGFYFENKRVSEAQPFARMIFQDVKRDSFIWRWQGRAKAEDPWTDKWVIQYRRKKA